MRIGVSGFRYTPWRGVFYPVGLKAKDELCYLAQHFSTLELNGSFYSLQRPESYARWYAETPPGFLFSLKGGRYVTHMKRLREVNAALANFFASGVLCLGEKLGPILWQLPPTLRFEPEVLTAFFESLPRSVGAIEALAKRHDGRGRKVVLHAPAHVSRLQRVEHALEVRHPTFQTAEFTALLRTHDIACCIADSANKFPQIDATTSELVYVRLHGSTKLYESGYTNGELGMWARRIRQWVQKGHRVHVYFDNDAKVHAPFDALNLIKLLASKRRAA